MSPGLAELVLYGEKDFSLELARSTWRELVCGQGFL